MKIKALRVSEFGCFDGPVRIENFSGALDVLSGPNELGKSTLFDALKVVFSEKLSTRGGPKTALGPRVPYAGGAPRIEVDFTIDDTSYRLRKQFLSKAQAELSLLGAHTPLARNDEVEIKLAELFGNANGPSARTGLLWLAQGETLLPLELSEPESNALRGLVERDIVDIGGGSKARAMSGLIGRDLGALITRSRGQPTGAYKAAIAARDRARFELDEARAGLAKAEEAQLKLDRSKTELGAKTAAPILDELMLRVSNAEKEFSSAREARLKLQGAEDRLKHLTLSHSELKKRRGQFIQTLERVSSLNGALEEGRLERERARIQGEAADQKLVELEEQSEALRMENTALSAEQHKAEARREHATLLESVELIGQNDQKI